MSGHLTNLASMVNRKPRVDPPSEPDAPVPSPPMPISAAGTAVTAINTRPAGKRRSEDHERIAVYVRKETRRKAERKWEDEGHRDLSNLVEKLLGEYAGS